ncbi:DUF6318 family protein [Arthrobacter sp. NEB 688]|uniref:DUF6318 family protein n=1 Tax=Arthrobacter sp. NEB 688 TaxID=904039 RepID=UPI00156770CA|nr:DUF6318 family protein [Arthrobacter sp. NEB 688]QKE84428.1 hypothetical protein HL663_11095 [Arthrobacter sp. NEB 688]
MTRGTRWVVAGVALGSLLLTGCDASGSGEPSPTPTAGATSASPSPSASPSASPTPSESGPQIPAAAREQTPAGAEAMLRYYLDSSGKAWMAPDPGLLDGLATSNCVTCRNLRSEATDLVAQGRRYAATPVEIDQLTRLSASKTQVVFEMRLQQRSVDIVDASGAAVDQQKAEALKRAARLLWREDRWLIDGISQ